MAIDMIEQPQIAAMNFKKYKNTFFNTMAKKNDQGYANAVGISLMGNLNELRKTNKKIASGNSANAIAMEINLAYPISNNCTSLLATKEKLNQNLYQLNQEILAGHKASTLQSNIISLSQRLLLVKKRLTELRCEEAADAAQVEKDRLITLQSIKDASADNLAPGAGANTNKYIIWGIVGLMIISAAAILFKKKKHVE